MNKLPRLLVDIDKVKSNIIRMKQKADSTGIEFRPHFKTHQSLSMGKIFRDMGVKGITVSSVEMAKYFAVDGWNDITIAFPAPLHEINDINQLNESCSLKLLLSSSDSLVKLSEQLDNEVDIYIELNTGQNRSGLVITDHESIESLASQINDSENLNFYGFYCHAGQTYSCRSSHEVEQLATKALAKIEELAKIYSNKEICFGDTPSCSVLDDFGSVTQLSPGNFVFYDWMQFNIGSCEASEIAVMMQCPVVDINRELNQLIIHGGAIHFSKDSIEKEGSKIFGHLADDQFNPITGNHIKGLSQEHGIVQCTKEHIESISIGDSILVLPIHSCLTANLMAEYHEMKTAEVYDHKQKRPA